MNLTNIFSAKWRIPLGESGILNFFLEALRAHTLRHTLKIHILRLIGNSCADTGKFPYQFQQLKLIPADENRARVVTSNYLPSIILQLKDTSLLPFAIPVLYNICVDYGKLSSTKCNNNLLIFQEPAQLQASNSFLTKELIELISGPALTDCKAFLGYICKTLDLMITQGKLAVEPNARRN